jgi:hypothetical protein
MNLPRHFRKYFRRDVMFLVVFFACVILYEIFLYGFKRQIAFFNSPPLPNSSSSKPVQPHRAPPLVTVIRPGSFLPSFDQSNTVITKSTVNVVASSSPVFAYAHGTVIADGHLFVGMANRAGNLFSSRRLVVFPDPNDLNHYNLLTMPEAGEIDTMVYDQPNDVIYFALSGNGHMALYRLDPHSFGLSVVMSTSTVDLGRKPAIVTDGEYIYGITETDPSVVFKVRITDGTLTTSSGHIKNGHSAAIGIFGSTTELYFGGGMADGFEKVDAQSLRSLGTLNFSPCLISDDMPLVPAGQSYGYVFIGCESIPAGYRVRTDDLSVMQFPLPGQSLGMFSFNSRLYNAAQDGHLDVFGSDSLASLTRYFVNSDIPTESTSGQSLQLNELFYATTTDSVYFTAWWGVPGVYQLSHI